MTAATAATGSVPLFVGGRHVPAADGRTVEVPHRAGGPTARVSVAGSADATTATTAARAGLATWSGRDPLDRSAQLFALTDLLAARAPQLRDDLAADGTADPAAADAAVDRALQHATWWSGWADKLPWLTRGRQAQVTRPGHPPHVRGAGVVVAWVPGAAGLHGLVDALYAPLAAGGAVVAVVPATAARACATVAGAVAASGLPDGVVNVLPTGTEAVLRTLAGRAEVSVLDLRRGADDADLDALAEAATRADTRVRWPRTSGSGPSGAPALEDLVGLLAPPGPWHTAAP